jgi:pyroglutamyl-peptidase
VILLTGFEPFGGKPVNSSWEAARMLDGWVVDEWARVIALQLPVVWGTADGILRRSIASLNPAMVINLGQGSEQVSLERFARNQTGAQKADNLNHLPPGEVIDPAGPAAYQTRFELEAILASQTEAGSSAVISTDAGSYLCNFVSYHCYAALAASAVQTLFVHVPPVVEPTGADREKLAQIAASLKHIVRECWRQVCAQ